METVWFILVALMLTGYVVLDGFDIGAGALHLIAARTDAERRLLLRTIGPVWDGNEVWLLAAGGTLFYAFPLLYASSFSGFYLPLNIVLWLLVARAIGIEFRMHINAKIWTDFFDFLFSAASILLAIFFGAALGNVIRGVPLGPDHYFFAPLWTDFTPGAQPGVLDWYTVLSAIVALVALMLHGSLWVAMKTVSTQQLISTAIGCVSSAAAVGYWVSLVSPLDQNACALKGRHSIAQGNAAGGALGVARLVTVAL
jgi:cytochrome d ubiquinol oxidase subunit II